MSAHRFASSSCGRGPRRPMRPRLKPLLLAMSLAGLAGVAQAAPTATDLQLPTGMTLVAGQATVSSQVNTDANTALMTATQTSNRAVWIATDFSVGAKAAFVNNGPSALSDTLIRVIGSNPSAIYGSVTANNRLWLVNANGLYVGKGGSVSASSLLMSARDVDPNEADGGYANFMAGKPVAFLQGANSNDFSGGYIQIAPGGTVTADKGLVMVAPNSIYNEGTVTSTHGGALSMLVGDQATVQIGDSGYIELAPLTGAELNNNFGTGRALYNGSGATIQADDGQIKLIVAGGGNDGVYLSSGQDTMSGSTNVNGLLNAGDVIAQTTDGTSSVLMQVKGPHGSLTNSGTVDVRGKTSTATGGTINLVAGNMIVGLGSAAAPAQLLADGPAGGGQIHLVATNDEGLPGIYLDSTAVLSADATGTAGQGGLIRLLGAPNAPVVSDGEGGATANASTQTGLASFDASATSIVQLQGILRARGGTQSGDGGNVIATGTKVITSVPSGDVAAIPSVAQIDVTARNSAGKAGWWTMYSPQLYVGSSSALSNYTSGTQVVDSDLSTWLSTGANIRLGTYADQASGSATLHVLDGTHVTSTYTGSQTLALESVDNIEVYANTSGVTIEATQGPMNISLTADVDHNGAGWLDIESVSSNTVASAGRASAQGYAPSVPVTFSTQGGDITLTGPMVQGSVTQGSGYTYIDSAVMDAHGGKVTILGTGGVYSGDGTYYEKGISLSNTDITGGDILLSGVSAGDVGLYLKQVSLTTTTNGSITLQGYSGGAPQGNTHIGVQFDGGVDVALGSSGKLKVAGLAEGGSGNDGVGVSISSLNITTSGVDPQGAVPRVTIAGESLGSSTQPGLQVNGGIHLYASDTEAPSNADVVIGAKAGSNAAYALQLGESNFYTSGRINLRPLSVDAAGAIADDVNTPIYLGYPANGATADTNFIIPSGLFSGSFGTGLNIVVGSNKQVGRITVGDQVLTDQTTVTLQNQGTGSQGIVLGAQGGQSLTPAQAGRSTAQATTTTTAGAINLVTSGDVSQTGAIVAQSVNVIAGSGSNVVLNNAGNQIGTLRISGTKQVSVAQGATPSSATPVTAFDAQADQFVTVSATEQRTDTTPIDAVITQPRAAVESSETLGELRTDVYVRGQMTRPQVCTPANTGGSVGADIEVDALAQQWLQVRRSAQLSTCSGVRNDSNCSAF